ncbi:MAG: hypothetical protein WBJ81_01475, partial [Rickettsiales bacterium]
RRSAASLTIKGEKRTINNPVADRAKRFKDYLHIKLQDTQILREAEPGQDVLLDLIVKSRVVHPLRQAAGILFVGHGNSC